jgi:hypothetical protein
MVVIAALATQRRQPNLLLLEWAHKAQMETPPVAILIEMGGKDKSPRDWSGRATVAGGRVVHREGYRFRKEDKLTEPDGWQASSHRGLRVPPKAPQVSKMEGLATVGVVLHLADLKGDATLTLERKDGELGKAEVSLKEVVSGKAQKVWNSLATVRLISTATPITQGKTEDDFPAACYGPDGTLWVAYVSYTLRDESRRIEQQPYKEQPESFKALYKPEFADQLFVKYFRGGKWSEPIAVTGPKESIARCAIAAEGNGDLLVAYSALRQGRQNLFARSMRQKGAPQDRAPRLGSELRIDKDELPQLDPVACTDQNGRIFLAARGPVDRSSHNEFGTDYSIIEKGRVVGSGGAQFGHNDWGPTIAADADGHVAVAKDFACSGDYDIDVMVRKGRREEYLSVATSSRFEARPAIAYDPKGRLWIAYEEGPEQWGKDSGALVRKGNPLYSARSVRVVCLQDGKLFRPVAELPTSTVTNPGAQIDALTVHRQETGTRYAYPKIGIDGKGRIWLTYRQNFGSRYTTHPGSYWTTYARRLDGDHWSEPIELHHSDGLLDSRPALLPHKSGGLLVIHNTDGRNSTPETVHNQIYLSYVNLPGNPVEPKLVPHDPGKKDPKLVAEATEEAKAVKRIRGYRVEAGGKKLRLLRGEFHRHTEISWDGGADGSLEDMFRYAIDAASLDWIGNGDHDNGAGREYPWWLTQKFTDAYLVPGAFTPMFSYERSVSYPHGHRNCLFAKRGVLTLPRLAAPKGGKGVAGVHPDDTKMLYRYLKEMDGICASHTSATGMGTDWRDNDPAVEPVVEIYQGDRMSYEHEGAPRAGYDPKSGKQPANIAGWFPKGYVNHALEKGYRLGFQSSSDHWSTHISFFVILAEKNERQALLDAVRKRHTYAATDNIVLDVRSGEHMMGDEFKTAEAPALRLVVLGTGKLAKIDILRDSKVVATLRSEGAEYRGTWTDPAPQAGTHYYYVRVLQEDGELAWGSPMWITRE